MAVGVSSTNLVGSNGNDNFRHVRDCCTRFAHGVIALGNDAGILSVDLQSVHYLQESKETDVVGLFHLVTVLGLFLLTCFVFALRDWQQFAKIGSAFVLVFAIAVVPDLSVKIAEQTSPDRDMEWDSSWPNEWRRYTSDCV